MSTDAAEAWDLELRKRIEEVEAGTATLVDAEDVVSNVRARLASR